MTESASDPPVVKARPALPPGPFLVVGLARSGQAAVRLLAGLGEQVAGCDTGRPEGVGGIRELGVELRLDADGIDLLDSVRTVVKSPGVPGDAPVVVAARERGIDVVGELELAWRLVSDPLIAVTGTNGKTTTAELIAHLYRAAGKPVELAGNIGAPLSGIAAARAGLPGSWAEGTASGGTASQGAPEAPVGAPSGSGTVVCEVSSFQLEDTVAFAPECAVLLNLRPDHLDRHRSFEEYRRAKLQIFANQAEGDTAVINGDDPAAPEQVAAREVRFCPEAAAAPEPKASPGPGGKLPVAQDRGSGAGCEVSRIGGAIYAGGEPLIDVSELQILGPHNIANAMAAAATALAMGLDRSAVADGLASFTGVAHRLEPVAEIGGVLFINDSKATNVAAATTALDSFAAPVHVILGGSLKGEDFAPLAGPLAERARACYLIGPAAAPMELALREEGIAGVEIGVCGDLAAAVHAAAAAARPGEVVLLSPGCASFDAFRDYEERGEAFRGLVEELR